MPPSYTFHRTERLKSTKVIASLFTEGQSFVAYPLRVVWMVSNLGEPGAATMAVSVSKRLFKTAVQRNRLKRQIREAYRLHKPLLYQTIETGPQLHISLMITYIAKEPLPYRDIEGGIHKLIRKLGAAISQLPATQPALP